MNLFQDQDVRGFCIKNYTQSVLEEVTRIRLDQKNVSNLITVVIGQYRCIAFQNFPYFIEKQRGRKIITTVTK
jgi:hypothetical protein